MAKQIPLTQGQVAIVCDCHAHLVENHKWSAVWNPRKKQFLAVRSPKTIERLLGAPKTLQMHVVINNTPKGMQTDHIDNNSLNNQCSNLRTATPSQNQYNRKKLQANTSGFKGVFKTGNRTKPWRARLNIEGKKIHVGVYATAEEAAHAYDKKAKEMQGEFANPNFPE